MPTQPITAYIAFGSNLGDRSQNIAQALRQVAALTDTRVGRVSKLIENSAVGGPAGSPDFFNGVAEIVTSLAPGALLQSLHGIERAIGRVRRDKWEPRIIDLDLLLYGDQIISGPDLTVPHPLLHTRLFVLAPLGEIAPECIHPNFGVSIQTLLKRFNRGDRHLDLRALPAVLR